MSAHRLIALDVDFLGEKWMNSTLFQIKNILFMP